MQLETYYHIYNHVNGDENLFRSVEKYHFFLRQWAKYIEPIAETYAYCLMPNHLHFLIRIRQEEAINSHFDFPPNSTFGKFGTSQKLISKQFANLFSSYTQAFNKRYNRKGSLFIPNFKRKEITNDAYLTTVVAYIHHCFCSNMEDWPHSSYHAYLSSQKTKIKREPILGWFHGKERFIKYHQEQSFLPGQSLFIDF